MALCKLNHTQQVLRVEELSKKQNLIGFRVATSSVNKLSYVWLLRCLIKNLNDSDSDINPAHLHLERFSSSAENMQPVWDDISNQLNLPQCPPGTKIEKIITKICEKLKKEQHIILLFYRVDERDKKYLESILNKFWLPLIKKAKQTNNIRYRLLMCWLDYQSPIDWRDNLQFLDDNYQQALPESLFNLDVTEKFELDDLKVWVKSQDTQRLIGKLTEYDLVKKENLNNIIETIWRNSKEGEPKQLLKEIYKLCKLSWEEHKWEQLY
jgi:inactive STAND